MEIFYETKADEIAKDLEGSLAGALESLIMGAAIDADPFAAACEQIDERFRTFLSTKEIEGLGVPGVPTKAAQKGISHRRAHPYAKRGPRPSFIDTGLFSTSFRSWVD